MMAWPFVALLAFSTFRASVAVSVTVLGGVLLLPGNYAFDLPMIPDIDHFRMSALSALLAGLLLRSRSARIPAGSRAFLLLPAMAAAFAATTALLNRDPLALPDRTLPGMALHDLVSSVLSQLLDYGVPFVLGMLFFRRRRDLSDLVACMAAAGVCYSPLILFELRMSPDLHRIVYGVLHTFDHTMTRRFGGWRPVVFLPHGLALAMFVLTAACAAAVAWKARLRRVLGIPWQAILAFLATLFVACKSLGSLVYGAVVLPALAMSRPAAIARIAAILAVLVLAYPALRVLGWFPTEFLVETAERIDPLRAQSLDFRFENEELLVEKLSLRPWFGWGTWGRNRSYDPVTGEDVSTTDGRWIIVMGAQGVLGFAAVFGMLVVPVFSVWWNLSRFRSASSRHLLAGSSLLLMVNVVDLLPNGFLLTSTIMLSGALASLVPGMLREQARAAREAPAGEPGCAPVPARREEAPVRLGEELLRGARRSG